MTQPNPNPQPHRRSRRLAQMVVLGGGVVLIGAVAAGWWAWRFINNQLAPLVAENLSKTFDRPVEVGPVEGVSLTELRFGRSTIPPTATDPDRVTVEAVTARFNLLELLWDRTLSLDVTLVQPDIYIAQDREGLWITTQIQESDEPPGPISIELDSLRIEQGTAQLVPYGEVESSRPVETDGQPNPSRDEDAPATLPPSQAVNPVVGLNQINGVVTFRNDNKLIGYDVAARPETGGRLRVEGNTNLDVGETTLAVESRDLLAPDISLLVPLPLKLRAGRLASDLEVLFPPDEQPLQFNGSLRFRDVVGQLDGAPQLFQDVNGALRFQGQRISFQDFRGSYGQIATQVSGGLDTQRGYNLKVRVPQASVANILDTLDLAAADLPVAATGTFQAEFAVTGAIDQPAVSGTGHNLQPVQIDRLRFAQTQAQFSITPQAVVINQFRALPEAGGAITARGRVNLGERAGLVVDVQANGLPGDAIASAYGASSPNFSIGQVDATAQVFGPLNAVQTVVQWQAPQATYPGRGRVVIANQIIRFEDTAVLAAGGIVRGNGQIRDGRWQAALNTSGIELNQFNPELRGLFSGDFRLGGSLSNFSPEAIQAEGDLRLSEGLAVISGPLKASVRWLGDRLQIVQAAAPGFRSDGFIFAQLQGSPGIERLDLNLDLTGYRLADLPVELPSQVQVAGTTDFSGRVTGPLDAIKVAGQLGLNNFAVNTFAFEPRLAGDVQFALNQGGSLDLRGQQDRIALVLDDRNRPRSFYVRQQDTIAEGRGNGDRLLASLTNFPLEALNLTPATTVGLSQVSGRLNGNFDINLANLANPAVIGEVAIANPAIDYIAADSFTGKFRYINGVAVLEEGAELKLGNSRYLLEGRYDPGVDPQFQGAVVADQGRVEDIFALLRWFELGDLGRIAPANYASSADVATVSVGLPNATLLNQLRRFSEVNALYRQQVIARERSTILPELDTLEGGFTGRVNLAYSNQAGPSLDFDLRGQDWLWGDCRSISQPLGDPLTLDLSVPLNQRSCRQYRLDQVIAQGNLQNGVVTLLPVRLESDDSLLTFSGQVGGPEQSGQLIAQNVPVAPVRDLLRLPVNVEGVLNARAQLGGSVENPELDGEINLVDGQVNQTQLDSTLRTLFGYNDARLNFNSRFVAPEPAAPELVASAPEPVAFAPVAPPPPSPPPSPSPTPPNLLTDDAFLFTGSIPYKLPFATVAPADYQLSVDLNVRNDGLSLINLFTDQVAWRGGDQGAVQLQVRGVLPPDQFDFSALTASGRAEFTNGRIDAKALAEDLTNVNGTILFEQDRIRIAEPLVGQLGEGGNSSTGGQQLAVTGVLPLLYALRDNDPDIANPLMVQLNNLALDLTDLYRGDVNGEVLITGAALAPQIGGLITLSNGRILIPNPQANVPTATTAPTASAASPFNRGSGVFIPPQYDALQVVLGERLRVTYDPVLNFLVQGTLLVSGSQPDPLLDGVVQLRSGQVNLFTNQFNLDRGYRNTAEFNSAQGLDPTLNVSLVTSVPEVTRFPNQTNSPFPVSEIVDDASAGDFGALQTVRVQARVEDSPASQLFENLELSSSPRRSETEILALLGGGLVGGNATTALASLVGSSLLTELQNLVNDTLGITDFRLFPTTIISQDSRTTSLALATELGIDLTDNLSVSVLQLLTVREQPQLGLRYRLNDQFLLRGSTNFNDESRAVLEFETRF
ncbi:MAG: translocation/assembly module TamB domain-containing protein [Elainella sp.]